MSHPVEIVSLSPADRLLEELLKAAISLRNREFTIPPDLSLIVPELYEVKLYGELLAEGDLIAEGDLVVW